MSTMKIEEVIQALDEYLNTSEDGAKKRAVVSAAWAELAKIRETARWIASFDQDPAKAAHAMALMQVIALEPVLP